VTEVQELKAQLVAVLSLSNAVEGVSDPLVRRLALDELQSAIQSARPLLETYAADLLVELED